MEPAATIRLVRVLLGTGMATLLALAVFFLARTVAEQPEAAPLSAGTLFLTGAILAGLALGARWVLRSRAVAFPRWFYWLPSLPLWLIGLALILRPLEDFAIVIYAVLILAEEGVAWQWYRRPSPPVRPSLPPGGAEIELGDEDTPLDPQIEQALVRRTDPQEGVMVYGRVRARFEPGQRLCSLHVGFCPPLPFTPQLYIDTSEGPAATVKVAQTLPVGVRLEVRLVQPAATPQSVVLAFAASRG